MIADSKTFSRVSLGMLVALAACTASNRSVSTARSAVAEIVQPQAAQSVSRLPLSTHQGSAPSWVEKTLPARTLASHSSTHRSSAPSASQTATTAVHGAYSNEAACQVPKVTVPSDLTAFPIDCKGQRSVGRRLHGSHACSHRRDDLSERRHERNVRRLLLRNVHAGRNEG